MDHNQDFSGLRNLLALKKLEMPVDTDVNRFLIEFHRRQRAQLLVPQSAWGRAVAWIQEKTEDFAFFPALSYTSAAGAIALTIFASLPQQTQVASSENGVSPLAFHMPAQAGTFAMIPASFAKASTPSQGNPLTFNADSSATTRFVLANSHVAYDATVAF